MSSEGPPQIPRVFGLRQLPPDPNLAAWFEELRAESEDRFYPRWEMTGPGSFTLPDESGGAAMSREELLAFAYWLLEGEFGEGHEEEIVDKYLASPKHAEKGGYDYDCAGCGHPMHDDICNVPVLTDHFEGTNHGGIAPCGHI